VERGIKRAIFDKMTKMMMMGIFLRAFTHILLNKSLLPCVNIERKLCGVCLRKFREFLVSSQDLGEPKRKYEHNMLFIMK